MTWRGWQKTITPDKRRLVLPAGRGQAGHSSLPPEAAEAACHGGTVPTAGHRAATAATAPAIAATASAAADPAAAGTTGSTPTSTSSTVKNTRTCSALPANRRRQPRTVSTGRPSLAAIARTPEPRALAASAAPITSARSARRSSTLTGSRTWVTAQPRHRVRRGRSRTR
jgi:hypothetical protein